MKQKVGFWVSIERYGWRVIERAHPLLPTIVVSILLLVMVISFASHKRSVVGLRSLREVIEKATRVGDYPTAQEAWNKQLLVSSNEQIKGVSSELEDLVFPERAVEREIEKYEQLLEMYPGHRDIYLALAELNERIKNEEKAREYWELAKVLDPNNKAFK